ncbi:MAG: hypothetical protein M1836_000575 [Candelina mexicana]|nr:MAG: hypothetical protein M1836_000575 [Candelina mexicana]
MSALDNPLSQAISEPLTPLEHKYPIHVRRKLFLPAITIDNNIREVSRQDPPSPPPNPPPSPTYMCLVPFIDPNEVQRMESEDLVMSNSMGSGN